MTDFALTALDRFPAGTSVGAYPRSGWAPHQLIGGPSGAPPVAASESQTMGASGATFTTLADGTDYLFGAQISGVWRYVAGRVTAGDANEILRGTTLGFADLDGDLTDAVKRVFSVKDYGARGDGVAESATPFQQALEAARAVGGEVYIDAGTYLVSDIGTSTVFRLPADTILGAGKKVRIWGPGIIQGSANTPRLADWDRSSDDQYFHGYDFDGVRFNRDGIGAGNNDAIFGNRSGGSYNNGQRANFYDISVRNCHFWGLPRGTTTKANVHIAIVPRQTAGGQALNTISDIFVENNTLEGGDGGIAVIGNGPDATVSITYDRVFIRKNRWDSGALTDGTLKTAFGCQVGGYAAGGLVEVSDNDFSRSWDVGIEVDNHSRLISRGNRCTDSATVNFLYINFLEPIYANAQRATCWGDQSRVIDYNPVPVNDGVGNGYGWYLSNGGGLPTLGSVTLIDCSHYSKAPNLRVNGEAIACPGIPARKLALVNFRATHESVNDTPGAAPNWSFIRWGSSVANQLDIDGMHLALHGTYGGPAAALRFVIFEGAGPAHITIDKPTYECTITAAGSTIYCEWYGKAAGSANAVISSAGVRRRRAHNWTTTVTTKVRGFTGDPALGITTEILDTDCDHSSFPSATAADTLFGDTTNRPKVKSRGGTPVNAGNIASAGTITLLDKGDSFVISGTTGITAITPSWNGRRVTLRFLGTLTVTDDGGALNLAGNFPAANNGMLTVECDGTNWREVARAVN